MGSGNLKRFIRYLYEYEQGKRTRNVGFVKVECDYEVCTVHIHGRGLRMGEDRKLALYLFYEEDGQCIGIWRGETRNVNPAVNYRLKFTKEDTGEPENFDKIKGVILEGVNGEKYAAVWDDMPVNVNEMKPWEDLQRERKGTSESPRENVVVEEEQQEEFSPEQTDSMTDMRIQIEELQVLDISRSGRQQASSEADSASQKHPWQVAKIQRKELVKLPRCEWRLSNNSFLMHGYYNYHHLVLIDDGQVHRLGVPGVYHDKEARAAAAFGFPEFIPAADLELTLSTDENDESEQFGYWCKKVRR